MLNTFPSHPAGPAAGGPHPAALWIDLAMASPDDVRLVEQMTGVHVPSREELDEIESSSRLYRENGALYLSMPIVRPDAEGVPNVSPIGFVVTAERLITVRFADLPAFASFATDTERSGSACGSSVEILAALLAGIVERVADALERISADLDRVSHAIFHANATTEGRHTAANAELRAALKQIGRVGDLASKLRDALLGIDRIVPYLMANTPLPIGPDLAPRFESVRQDVRSLSEYESHIASKTEFMLNATLGLINIEQNNIIKVLTVVSVVGVPPTLVASIYGMNFEHMPELHWAWGYPYGLALVFGSALVSLIWFRVRGWL
jgi:magnesium transporter